MLVFCGFTHVMSSLVGTQIRLNHDEHTPFNVKQVIKNALSRWLWKIPLFPVVIYSLSMHSWINTSSWLRVGRAGSKSCCYWYLLSTHILSLCCLVPGPDWTPLGTWGTLLVLSHQSTHAIMEFLNTKINDPFLILYFLKCLLRSPLKFLWTKLRVWMNFRKDWKSQCLKMPAFYC